MGAKIYQFKYRGMSVDHSSRLLSRHAMPVATQRAWLLNRLEQLGAEQARNLGKILSEELPGPVRRLPFRLGAGSLLLLGAALGPLADAAYRRFFPPAKLPIWQSKVAPEGWYYTDIGGVATAALPQGDYEAAFTIGPNWPELTRTQAQWDSELGFAVARMTDPASFGSVDLPLYSPTSSLTRVAPGLLSWPYPGGPLDAWPRLDAPASPAGLSSFAVPQYVQSPTLPQYLPSNVPYPQRLVWARYLIDFGLRTETYGDPRVRPRARPKPEPRKRPPGEKERKGQAERFPGWFSNFMQYLTESDDWLDAAIGAVPDGWSRFLRESGGARNTVEKAKFVFRHWQDIDLDEFMVNALANQFEDWLIGKLKKREAAYAQEIFRNWNVRQFWLSSTRTMHGLRGL